MRSALLWPAVVAAALDMLATADFFVITKPASALIAIPDSNNTDKKATSIFFMGIFIFRTAKILVLAWIYMSVAF